MKLSQKSPEALSTLCSWSALFPKHIYCISSYSVSPLQASPPSDSQHFFPHDSFNVSSTIGSKLSLSFLYQAGAVVKYTGLCMYRFIFKGHRLELHVALRLFFLLWSRSQSQRSRTHCSRNWWFWLKVMTELCWTAMSSLPPWQLKNWASVLEKCEF